MGLQMLLQTVQGVEVVGLAADGLEAVRQAAALRPDLILMDISMPRMCGIEATRAIKSRLPSVGIIGLSMHDEATAGREMREAGACAYLNKATAPDELVDAIAPYIRRNGT